ncbi:unnamed protein product [Prorocentrum cordatum]|uniref:Uncharacterized protein n=1 Tax=Prorocentrum cordatum TaxID=2364126 RepID=A0ABN9TCZ5_9DINO|nr:unnamed protein product [Polarella glacialis]
MAAQIYWRASAAGQANELVLEHLVAVMVAGKVVFACCASETTDTGDLVAALSGLGAGQRARLPRPLEFAGGRFEQVSVLREFQTATRARLVRFDPGGVLFVCKLEDLWKEHAIMCALRKMNERWRERGVVVAGGVVEVVTYDIVPLGRKVGLVQVVEESRTLRDLSRLCQPGERRLRIWQALRGDPRRLDRLATTTAACLTATYALGIRDGPAPAGSWDTTNPFSLNSLFFSNESNHFHFRGECKGEKVDRSSSYTQSDCSIDDLDERHGNLVSGMRSFGSQYLRQLRSAASGTVGDHGKMAVDMVMFGEFGRDLDKEKAVCVAVAMQRLGLVGHISLVASGNGAPMRARLALGTARKLEAECTAAIGHEGSPQDEVFPFEFDHCDYLSEEAEVDPAGGHELVFTAIGRAAREGRRVCIVVSSSLTDMAAVLRDARWPEASAAVSCVVVSGGATQPKADGRLVMDPAAGNNASDLRAAKEVYNRLQASERPPFYVVSRHAAGQCQLQRLAFHGSLHPVAQRFQHVSKDIVQSIWARVNRSMAERKRVRDSLPARCNVHWFREHFLSKDAPKDLKATDPVWEWAKNLRETCSDGLATVVATLADKPALMVDFFTPQKSSDCNLFLLGLDSTNHGINNPMALSKLIHELMIVSVGSGNGEWFRLVTDVGKVQEPVDAIIIGDYGKDLDDEKALCVASVLRGLGLIGSLAVVANLGDSTTRARLAKGSLLTLNQTDVPVAAGSHGGRDDEELYEHEFAHCDYI